MVEAVEVLRSWSSVKIFCVRENTCTCSQMMSGLSKSGKLVLEAVYKNWLEMYGSQRNETAGQINDAFTILEEIFSSLVTSWQPKQLVELRTQEYLEKSEKVMETYGLNKCSKSSSSNNSNCAPDSETCENVQVLVKEHVENTLSYDLSTSASNCNLTSPGNIHTEGPDVIVSSKNGDNLCTGNNYDITDKIKSDTLKSKFPTQVLISEKKTVEKKNNIQSGLLSFETDIEEILKINENPEVDSQSLSNSLCTGNLNCATIKDMSAENTLSYLNCREQPAREISVFKKPELPQNKTQEKDRDNNQGLEWFYESHSAFSLKWAISNECSLFDSLQDSSVYNSPADTSEEKSCNRPSESIAENLTKPLEDFDILTFGNSGIIELNKPRIMGSNITTNDNSLEVAVSHGSSTVKELKDEYLNCQLPYSLQFDHLKSTQMFQQPKSNLQIMQHKRENETLDILPKFAAKHSYNNVMFSERKAKLCYDRKYFRSPVTLQNSSVSGNRNMLAEHNLLPAKTEKNSLSFPVDLHDETPRVTEIQSSTVNSQQENIVKQNKTFRIFKTKSASFSNPESSFLKNPPVPRKLKQQTLDSFNFVHSSKHDEFDISVENIRTSRQLPSDVKISTVYKSCALKDDLYRMSETHPKEVKRKSLLKVKENENRSLRKKIKFEQPLKQRFLSFKQESSLQETAEKTDEVKFCFSMLMKDLFDKLRNDLKENLVQEIIFAIVYKGGFCQLNKPVGISKSATCNPNGIMLGIMDTACNIKYYYLEICSAFKTVESRDFLLDILNSQCRMICFEAQEMFALLIDEFHFSPRQVCMKWLMIDPMVGCWLLDPDHPVSTFSETVERLKVTIDMNQKLELWKNDGASTSNALNCCCHLLQVLSMVAEKLYESLSSQYLWELFTEVELKLTPLLAVMELRGIYVDKSEFQKMSVLLEGPANLLQIAAYKAAGKQFLLTSPKQLRTILYHELKLDQKHGIHVKETSILKEKSTSESMLHLLEPLHSLPGIILEYRHIQKIKSTYVDGMLQQIKNSTIFTTWEQTATATGRISSSNPNLQAVPKQPVLLSSYIAKGLDHPPLLLRSPYVSRPGFSFLAADFQHIEFRVFAHLAQDSTLLQAFQQPGDIFLALANLWLKPGGTGACPEDREKTKRIVYSVMYGAGAGKLAEFLQVDSAQANGIINSFIGKFPALRSFFNSVISVCHQKGELRTFSGRHRLFPAINSLNPSVSSQAERQAINFLIQGTAADICKAAMLLTEKQLSQQPDIEAYLLLQIHDELLWEVRDSHLGQMKKLVRSVMEDTSSLYTGVPKMIIPLPVIITSGKTWACMTAT